MNSAIPSFCEGVSMMLPDKSKTRYDPSCTVAGCFWPMAAIAPRSSKLRMKPPSRKMMSAVSVAKNEVKKFFMPRR
jgi:hypothetical protein